MVKKIALWGYGYHGKDVESAINQSHLDRFQIAAIFDVRFDELNRDNPELNILNPAKIKDYYQQGLFDAVMVTVYSQEQKNVVDALLTFLNVPTLDYDEELNNRSLFRPAEFFPQGRVSFSWQERKGYGFHALRDMRMSFVRKNGIAFLFDENKRFLSSCWRKYHFGAAPYLKIFFPPETKKPVLLSGEWCFLAKVWSPNYWHFTYESLDQIWLLEKCGYTGRYILPKEPFVPELTSLLGVAPERIAWREDFNRDETYQFETLVCTELLKDDRRNSAVVLVEMANYILNRLQPGERQYPSRVFIKRIGKRKLILDEETEELLDQLGFETIVPEELSVSDQILYFNRADIVFSPHGANSTNSLYMRPGAAFIETFPFNYVNPCCIETSYRSRLRYLPVFEPYGPADGSADLARDYKINPQLLEMTIRNAIALTEQSDE